MRNLLILLCVGLASGASAQQAGIGAVNGPASVSAMQICARDTAGICRVPQVDAAGRLAIGGAAGQIATAQVSVGTSAVQVAGARDGRTRVMFSVGSANTCYFGPAGVTSATGFALAPTAGAALMLDTSGPVFAVCSATTTVSVLELFG